MISPKGCSWGESIPEQICLVYGRGHRQSPGLSGGGSRSDLEQDLGYRALDSASRLRVPECSLPDEKLFQCPQAGATERDGPAASLLTALPKESGGSASLVISVRGKFYEQAYGLV